MKKCAKRFFPMKRNYILCGLTAMLFGCSLGDESIDMPTSYAKIGTVNLNVEPFVIHDDLGTRTTLTHTATEFAFSWSEGDTLGLFPVAPVAGSQVYQVLEEKQNAETGALSHEFDGGAWQLRAGNSYVAYHPFKKDMKVGDTYTDVPVNMLGQKQIGKSSTAHIGKYDYMYAKETSVPAEIVDGELPTVDFEFKHAVSIAIVNLTVPVAKNWKKIIFEATDNVFVTKAVMDARTGVATAVERSEKYEFGLQNISSSANEVLTFYLTLLPTTISDAVTVTAVDENNVYYTGTLKAKTFEMGQAYMWSATLNEADAYAGKDYVLLAGSLWCRYNLNLSGAAGGEYYAWGETAPKESYAWSNYKFGSSPDQLGYYSPGSFTYTSLRDRDDVALSYMPAAESTGHWRIPTKQEMRDLIEYCTWIWDSKTKSYKVVDPNNSDRYIILPATSAFGDVLEDMWGEGFYWTRDVVDDESTNWSTAYYLYFDDTYQVVDNEGLDRCYGLMIRPVYVFE
jgi:hypothetical protein